MLLGSYRLTAAAGVDAVSTFPEVGYLKAGSTSDLHHAGSQAGGSLSGPNPAIIQAIATVDHLGSGNGFLLITDYIPGFADEKNTPFSQVSVTGGLSFTLETSDFTTPVAMPVGNPTFVIYITGGIPKVSGQFVPGSTYSVTFN